MAQQFKIQQIGFIQKTSDYKISIDKVYRNGLVNLKEFSHLQILWWAHLSDGDKERFRLTLGKLFKKGPERMGIFSTRAPVRPNPIMVSTIKVSGLNIEKGIIQTPFIDAEPGSPVLDIKPYYSMERVRDCKVPEWCEHWPEWQEDAMQYDWSQEMNQLR